MKYHFRLILLSAWLVTVSPDALLAQLTTSGVLAAPNYNTLIPPATGGTYADPAFGPSIKRVSNALNTPNADRGGYLGWIENEYATMSAFNSDNSKFILVHQSYFALYDGSGFYIHDLPLEINSSSEPRWSRKDNATLYYHVGNQLKSYNLSSGGINVVHAFSEYSSITGKGEMDISLDGDHFVFVGDGRFVFVYEISTGKKSSVLDTSGHALDAVYITPNNNVTATWTQSGTGRYTGIELFDSNMNFLRQVAHAGGHMDVTRDVNGDEVLVWTNSNDPQPIANCNNGVVKINLGNGAQTCLLQLDWSLAVHISAPDGNGFAYVDTEAPGNPESGTSNWVAYTNEILQVKLDGSGTTRWAHHRSRAVSSYNWQPKFSVSRDGTRGLYASNFHMPAMQGYSPEYADTYLIAFAGSGTDAPPAAPIAPTSTPSTPPPPATSVTRYEQDHSAISYGGTWHQNKGAFNSGAAATLAADAGSQAKLTFAGTAVKWIGYRDAWSGIAKVYLDGALKATVDTYSQSDLAQSTLYSAESLTSGTHTLTIVATGQRSGKSGGAWIWLDAFDVSGDTATTPPTASTPAPAPSQPSAPARIEQSDSAVVYTGGSWFPNTGAFNSGGSAALALDANARATLTFSGTAVSWTGYRDEWSGVARVYIDGILKATVDTYSSPSKSKSVLYTASGLAKGTHTFTIEVLGAHGPSSAGNWVWVDAFDVTP